MFEVLGKIFAVDSSPYRYNKMILVTSQCVKQNYKEEDILGGADVFLSERMVPCLCRRARVKGSSSFGEHL